MFTKTWIIVAATIISETSALHRITSEDILGKKQSVLSRINEDEHLFHGKDEIPVEPRSQDELA